MPLDFFYLGTDADEEPYHFEHLEEPLLKEIKTNVEEDQEISKQKRRAVETISKYLLVNR